MPVRRATESEMLEMRRLGILNPLQHWPLAGIDRHFSAFYSLCAVGCSEGGQNR